MRLILILTLTMLSSWALAADLTTKDVETWMKSAPELQEWLMQHEEQLSQASTEFEDIANQELSRNQAVAQLKEVGVYDDLQKRVSKAGYSNVEQWIEISQQISMAFTALVLEEEVNQREEIQAQLKQLESMGLPEEHQEAMRSMLEGSLAMLNAIDGVSEADKQAVAPYLEELAAQVE